jgi:hypothetical protein
MPLSGSWPAAAATRQSKLLSRAQARVSLISLGLPRLYCPVLGLAKRLINAASTR